MVQKQILKARAFSRDTFLDRVKEVKSSDRFVFTFTNYSSFNNFQNVLKAHIVLRPNKENHKVFGDRENSNHLMIT